tara:strand:- start:78 stop:473 length:396 start_codon:yes stop_codon:yes gene_type:complete
MSNKDRIRQLAKKYGLGENDFWQLPNNKNVWIIKHDAVEKISKLEDIEFSEPTVVEHGRDYCALLGSAFMQTGEEPAKEWSFGEADLKLNCTARYPYAMAEKRLKDRLTLKLISAYEYGIYSEEEAEAFKK